MAPFRALACLSIYLALNIVTSNAQPYTYITNDMVDKVYASVGYNNKKDYVKRWLAEGSAIFKALEYLCSIYTKMFVGQSDIELIVASTGGNTCTYINGKAESLEKMARPKHKKLFKIIVVYTLNYVSELAESEQEFKNFKVAIARLTAAGAVLNPKIGVEVKQFRPVITDTSELVEKYDYQDYGKTVMEKNQVNDQLKKIKDLHAVAQEAECLTSAKFEALLKNPNVKLIVDGIVGSGAKSVNGSNQLLTAIPRAQIRIMATAILFHKESGSVVYVLCNDNPSGMDEYGNWTIDNKFWYPVNIILSCVWHKNLVNSKDMKGSPIALVLDITYNGKRLFDILLTKMDGSTDPNFKKDVEMAQSIKDGVISFPMQVVA